MFWDCYDYMETQAQADECKEQFFWSHTFNKQVLFAVFAESPISIILSHKFESNTVPGTGPGS